MRIVIDALCTADVSDKKTLRHYPLFVLNAIAACGLESSAVNLAQLLARQLQLEGRWALVTPVYWEASHNHASMVRYGAELTDNPTVMTSCFEDYAGFMAEAGIMLYCYSPGLWLMSVDNLPSMQSRPVFDVVHRALTPVLASMDDTGFWQKQITESQMFFYSKPYNKQVNGIWLWCTDGDFKPGTLPVYADALHMPLAQQLSRNAALYDPALTIPKESIILCESENLLSQQHQTMVTQRYWLNAACAIEKNNWLKTLWRRLFHAH